MEEVPEEVDPPLGPRPQDLGTLGVALEHVAQLLLLFLLLLLAVLV